MRPVLPVNVGQMLAARVVSAAAGTIELAVAGTRLTAQSDLPVTAGDTLRLTVAEAGPQTVRLRVVPDLPPPGVSPGAAALTADDATRPDGMSASTARAVTATLAQLGTTSGADAAARTALLARAQAAGVQTPAQGAAFARLLAAGLPTTPAAVQGLATLTEGPALGQSLTMLTTPTAPTGSPAGAGPGAAAAPTLPPAPPAAAPGGPSAAPMPGAPASPAPAAVTSPTASAVPAPGSAPAGPPPAGAPSVATSPPAIAGTTPPPAANAPAPAAAAAPPAAPPPAVATVPVPTAAALGDLVRQVAADAVSGDAERVQQAVARLGHGTEAHLRAGTAPPAETVRSALLQLAADPAAPHHLAQAADRAADATAAQALAAPALAPQLDPAQQGAYLQVPLPGGQTAEVRVMPDEGRDGGAGGSGTGSTRVAFLLHMSALGPVMVEATVGPTGVDAVVKAQSPTVRTFLEGQAPELAEGLARARPEGTRTRVSVDRLTPPPQRLLPGPPAAGLDVAA